MPSDTGSVLEDKDEGGIVALHLSIRNHAQFCVGIVSVYASPELIRKVLEHVEDQVEQVLPTALSGVKQ